MNAMPATTTDDGRSVTVQVPLAFRRRGGRKRVVAPDGAPSSVPSRTLVDSTLVKAIARAHRWQAMLESGTYNSIAELAAAERINPSYLARVLRLTLLAPKIVQAVLDGRSGEAITLRRLMQHFSTSWERQQF